MNNSTLEKVARALARDKYVRFGYGGKYLERAAEEEFTNHRYEYTSSARAALQSLRQVDDETVEAMEPAMVEWLDGSATDQPTAGRRAFTAGIDHILAQKP